MSGDRPRASDDLYAEVVHVQCPRCGAQANRPCVNQITEGPARVPHWQRVRAAEQVDQDDRANTVIKAEEETER